MTATVFIWLFVSLAVILPTAYLISRREWAFLPAVVLGIAIWLYLVAAMPLHEFPFGGDDWAIRYGILMLIATIPIWIMSFLSHINLVGVTYVRSHTGSADVLTFWGLWVLCLGGVTYFATTVGPPPLVEVIRGSGSALIGSAAALMDLRMESTGDEEFGNIRVFYYILPPLIAMLGHILYRTGKIGLVINVVSIVLALMLTVQYLHKTHLIILVAKLFLIDMYFTGANVRRLVILAILAFTLVLGMYVFYSGHLGASLVTGILRRIFIVYIEINDFVLTHWPTTYEYFKGATYPNPRGILPFEPVNAAGFVYGELRGGIGNAPISAFGEGYANFGFLGVLLIAALVSAWFVVLASSLQWAGRHAVGLAIWFSLAVEVNAFGRTSFFAGVNIRMLAVFAAAVVLYLVARTFIFAMKESKESTDEKGAHATN